MGKHVFSLNPEIEVCVYHKGVRALACTFLVRAAARLLTIMLANAQ